MYTLWLHTYFTAIVSVFRSAMGQNARYLLYSVLEQRDPHDFFLFNGRRLFVLRDRALRFSFEKNFDLRRPTVMTFCWLQTEHFWSEENCKRRSIHTGNFFILLVVIPRFTLDSVSN